MACRTLFTCHLSGLMGRPICVDAVEVTLVLCAAVILAFEAMLIATRRLRRTPPNEDLLRAGTLTLSEIALLRPVPYAIVNLAPMLITELRIKGLVDVDSDGRLFRIGEPESDVSRDLLLTVMLRDVEERPKAKRFHKTWKQRHLEEIEAMRASLVIRRLSFNEAERQQNRRKALMMAAPAVAIALVAIVWTIVTGGGLIVPIVCASLPAFCFVALLSGFGIAATPLGDALRRRETDRLREAGSRAALRVLVCGSPSLHDFDTKFAAALGIPQPND